MRALIVLLVTLNYHGYAQLGLLEGEILKAHGTEKFEVNKTKSGVPFVLYTTAFYTDASSNYDRWTYYYFDSTNRCNQIIIVEPIGEINAWIKTLNNLFVKAGGDVLIWEDYSTKTLITVESDEFSDTGKKVVITYLPALH